MHIFIDKYLGCGRSALALTLIFGLEVWWCVLFAGLFVWAVEAGGGSWFRARTKRTEILYIIFGIHTSNVVKLADRIEQRVSLSAA